MLRLVVGVVEVRERQHPLSVRVAGSVSGDGMVRRDVNLRGFRIWYDVGRRILRVHRPVSGYQSEHVLEVEVLLAVVDEDELRPGVHAMPDELPVACGEILSVVVLDLRHLADRLSEQGFTCTAVGPPDLGLLSVHGDDSLREARFLGRGDHVAERGQLGYQVLRVGVTLLLRDLCSRLPPCEVAGVLEEPKEVTLSAGLRDPVGPPAVIVPGYVDEGGELLHDVVVLLMLPDVQLLLGIFQRLYASGRDLPDLVGEVQALDASARDLERLLQIVEHRERIRAYILRIAPEEHFQYRLLKSILGKGLDEVCHLMVLDHLDDAVLHIYELKVAVRLLVAPEAASLEEVLGAHVAEPVFRLGLLLDHGPEHLVLLQRLRALKLVVLVVSPAALAERELRKVLQLVEVTLAEVLGALQRPELLDLRIRKLGDLVDLHPFALPVLLVPGVLEILEKIFLTPLQSVGQYVVGALVCGRFLAYVSEVELDVYAVILQLLEVVLEVPDRIEKVFRTPLDGVVHGDVPGKVVTVGIEHEDDLLDLALVDELYQILRKGALVPDVLDSGYGHACDSMLAGLLRLLLSFLQIERRDHLALPVCRAHRLRIVYECRGSHRRTVLDRPLVLVEVTVRVLVPYPVVGLLDLLLADLGQVGDLLAVKVVVQDDGIVALLVDLAVLVEGRADEGGLLHECLAVVVRVYRCGHVLVGQSGLLQHPSAEGLVLAVLLHMAGLLLVVFDGLMVV